MIPSADTVADQLFDVDDEDDVELQPVDLTFGVLKDLEASGW